MKSNSPMWKHHKCQLGGKLKRIESIGKNEMRLNLKAIKMRQTYYILRVLSLWYSRLVRSFSSCE